MKSDSVGSWIEILRNTLAHRNTQNSDILFHDLIYKAPDLHNPLVVKAIFESFLTPFDSGTMQCCITMLAAVPLELYMSSYIDILPALLMTQPTWATDLFDYPGRDLTRDEIRNIKNKLLLPLSGRKTINALREEILIQGLQNDEPWHFLIG